MTVLTLLEQQWLVEKQAYRSRLYAERDGLLNLITRLPDSPKLQEQFTTKVERLEEQIAELDNEMAEIARRMNQE